MIRNSTVLIIVLVALDHHLGRFTLLNSVFIQILSGYHACRFYRLNFMSLVIKFGNLLLCVHDLCSYILIRRSFTSELCYCSWYCILFELYFEERILLVLLVKDFIRKLEDWINFGLTKVLEKLKFLLLQKDSFTTNYVLYWSHQFFSQIIILYPYHFSLTLVMFLRKSSISYLEVYLAPNQIYNFCNYLLICYHIKSSVDLNIYLRF